MNFGSCKRAHKLSISYFNKYAMNTKRNEQNLTYCYCYEFLSLSEKSWTLYFVSPDRMEW